MLETAANRLDELVRALPDQLFVVDQDGIIQDLTGRALEAGPPERFPADGVALIEQVLGTGKPARMGYRVRADGQEKEFEARIAAMGDGRALCVVRDVSRERELERQALSRERQMALGSLSSALAHEIRNPLSTISGSAQILAQSLAGEPRQLRQVRRILEQCERLGELVESVLAYGKPRREPLVDVALIELLQDALTLSSIQYGSASSGVEVSLEARPRGARIHAEGRKIMQILINLMLNAFQALEGKGRLRLEASLEEGRARFSVRDDGPGIDPDKRAQIFDMFFTTKANGSGIGLAVCRQLSRSMGGELECQSPDGGGSDFILTLPVPGAV